ncbi:hypothetical protein NAT51_03910 [Flavobacterium amniphilum]|uniref:hypothetical protein n=1 Tax=Flavobacterium amniphilum TaxID=1834035 RepID=UPI00202AA775|nr:hypothetical protein [Flavobacterium amniphilum]MCL9804652.1 hypothetical protein [Flavobacterium amniphilum]
MRNSLLYFALFFAILGCRDEKPKPNLNKEDRVFSKNELLKGWRTYSKDSIEVNIPSTWLPESRENTLLYIPIDVDKDLFYVIERVGPSEISCRNYIKLLLKQFTAESKNPKYFLRKLNLKNKRDCFRVELYADGNNNVRHKFYNFLYDTGSEVYHFGYKTVDDKKMNHKNYQTFYSVLLSFVIQHDNVFDGDKIRVEGEQDMGYEDL